MKENKNNKQLVHDPVCGMWIEPDDAADILLYKEKIFYFCAPGCKIAFEKINAASGRFWSGISLPYPELEVSYEYIPTSQSVGNYSEKTFGFSQSIEFPTNYFLRGSKLSTAEEIAENEYKLSEIGLISKIKTAYFKALTNEEQLKIAKDNLSIAEDFYHKAEICTMSVKERTLNNSS